jgi:nucleobase transporter 1/2
MMVLAIFVKVAAVFATIPTPIIGGVLVVLSGIISSVGLSGLKYIDLNSSRNLFILGLSLFMGLCLPKYMGDHPQAIQTTLGSTFDQTIQILLQNSMLVSGFLAFFLDNTVPGTDEERGLTKWLAVGDPDQGQGERDGGSSEGCPNEENALYSLYNIPYIHKFVMRNKFLNCIPIFGDKPRNRSKQSTIEPNTEQSHMLINMNGRN